MPKHLWKLQAFLEMPDFLNCQPHIFIYFNKCQILGNSTAIKKK